MSKQNDLALYLDMEEGEISQEEYEEKTCGVDYYEIEAEHAFQDDEPTLEDIVCKLDTEDLMESFVSKLYNDTVSDVIVWNRGAGKLRGYAGFLAEYKEKIQEKALAANYDYESVTRHYFKIKDDTEFNGKIFLFSTCAGRLRVYCVVRYGKGVTEDEYTEGMHDDVYVNDEDFTDGIPDIEKAFFLDLVVDNGEEMDILSDCNVQTIDLLLQEIYRQIQFGGISKENRRRMIDYLTNGSNTFVIWKPRVPTEEEKYKEQLTKWLDSIPVAKPLPYDRYIDFEKHKEETSCDKFSSKEELEKYLVYELPPF